LVCIGSNESPALCLILTNREEIFVLEGTAYCHTAKRWIHPGEYACRPPGMVHGPFVCKDDQVG
jgi:hypothetical protein